MAKKRDRIDIIQDMLSAIVDKGGQIKPTHLMYKGNLSHAQMQGYLEELLGKECVNKVPRKGGEYFIITDKGREFLGKIREMREFDRTFGL
ncbi:MAG: winged helix-turn-helix domain-containing protein [Candidatus Woesearchaeota archaeon]